ncbi:unnamed protein product [Mytilus coruscus]|uniref:FLYWCH-type domain-containing protein n=1 Tax=Mytilus coruscus TaxID=42192 RepID=A0A6J7ZTX9_MYTCO|nr:unnamed protein product [Mytilus coruscus]
MYILHTETSRGVNFLIIDGHTYRQASVLKHNNIALRCTIKSCKARVTTQSDGLTIVKTQNEHNHVADDRKTEAKELRVQARKKSGDVSSSPSKIVRTELQGMKESHLEPKDLKNASLAVNRERCKDTLAVYRERCKDTLAVNRERCKDTLAVYRERRKDTLAVYRERRKDTLAVYRERRKDTPVLPKSRDDVHTATGLMIIETNKSENLLLRDFSGCKQSAFIF